MTSLANTFFGDDRADNVVIKGLTIEAQTEYGVFLEGAGQYHFDDCVFQELQNKGPILVNSTAGLDVKFSKCIVQVSSFDGCLA